MAAKVILSGISCERLKSLVKSPHCQTITLVSGG